MTMDYQEGYADGLAGAGMQDRMSFMRGADAHWREIDLYEEGFELGSLDRKPMLAKAQPA